MSATSLALAATTSIVRKPFNVKPANAFMLGLLGLTFVAGFTGSKGVHVAAGLALTGAVGYHVWKRRKAL